MFETANHLGLNNISISRLSIRAVEKGLFGGLSLCLCLVLMLFVMLAPTQSFAQPVAVQICVDVISDDDMNPAEGGLWKWLLSDHEKGSAVANPITLERTEQHQTEAAQCSPAVTLSYQPSLLRIHELVPQTFEWSGNTAGYPQWRVGGDQQEQVYKQGVGRDAILPAELFQTIPAGEVLRITFTNRDRWVENTP